MPVSTPPTDAPYPLRWVISAVTAIKVSTRLWKISDKLNDKVTATTDLVPSLVNNITGHHSSLTKQTSDPVAKEKQQEPSGFLILKANPSRPRVYDLAHIALIINKE